MMGVPEAGLPTSAPRAAWWWRPALPLVVVTGLLCLGIVNIATLATFLEVEDGVLWVMRDEGVAAAEIAAGSPAQAVGIRRGDLLIAIDDRPVQEVSDVVQALHAANTGTALRYTVLRLGTREVVDVRLALIPNNRGALYFLLAAVGIFSLLVGGAVRMRRPHDEATLHFFWLSVAFFGVFTFSFSGRLDKLDWVFYWGDAISILVLPPLFLHFSLMFPARPRRWSGGRAGRMVLPLIYAPAIVLGAARVIALVRMDVDPAWFTRVIAALDRFELLYLGVCLIGGIAVLVRALGEVRSITARRQLQWIAWGTEIGRAHV